MSRPPSAVLPARRPRACRRPAETAAPRGAAPLAGSVAAVALVLAGLSGCTSEAAPPDTPTPETGEQTAPLRVSAPVTRVAGRLSDRDRLAVRRQVEALVADYVSAAFLDPGVAPDELFPGFTDGATRLARARGAVLSRADLDADPDPAAGPDDASDEGAVATIEVVRAEAPVNVLAPRGRPAGATARLDLTLEVTPPPGDDEEADARDDTEPEPQSQDVRLRGRLLLTPVGQGWRIFGFDVTRTSR